MTQFATSCSAARWLLRAGAALPLVLACSVYAQEAAPAEPAGMGAAPVDNSGEIVVTASRREERLSKVPISVTALGRAQMDVQGIRQVQDVVALTPGVSFAQSTGYSTGNSTVYVRGIVSRAGAATTGVYIDDTPIQAIGTIENFLGSAFPKVFDLERVEVLRGPQGTLFGGGAEGGVIRFITPKLSLDTYSGYGRAEVAFTESGAPSYEGGAAFGGPIVEDKIGFRISAWHRRDGGYTDRMPYTQPGVVDKNSDSQNATVVRGSLLFAPSESLTITPALTYQRTTSADQSTFWPGLSDPAKEHFVHGNSVRVPLKDYFLLPTLTVDYDLSVAKFTSVSSYFYRKGSTHYDLTNSTQAVFGPAYFGLPQNFFPTVPGAAYYDRNLAYVRQKVFTEEARLQSSNPDSRLKWVAGVFYQRMKQANGEIGENPYINQLFQNELGDPSFDFGLLNGISLVTVRENYVLEQIAGFLNLDFRIVDRLTFTAGGRVAHSTLSYLNRTDGPANGGLSVASGKIKETPFTPKVALSFQATDKALYYASVAKGYRVGGVNPNLPDYCSADLNAIGLSRTPPNYSSDNTRSFEVGTKNSIAGGRIRYDASVYHIDWKKVQLLTQLNCGYSFTSNAGQAVSKGFDLTVQLRPVDDVTIGVAIGYTDAHYTKTVLVNGKVLVAKGAAVGNPVTGDVISPWSVSLDARYDLPFYTDYKPYVRAEYNYHSRNGAPINSLNPNAVAYDPNIPQDPPTHLVKMRAGIETSRFQFSVFVDNLLNAHPTLGLQHNAVVNSPVFSATTFRPRTFGLTGIFRY